MTVDASATMLWDIALFATVTTPEVLRLVQPNARLLAFLRDPTERLLSDYLHFFRKDRHDQRVAEPSAHHFHSVCTAKVDALNKCFRQQGVAACLLCSNYRNDYCRLELGIYSFFLQIWQSFFSEGQLLTLPLSKFSENPAKFLKAMFKHVGASPLTEHQIQKIVSLKHRNKNIDRVTMLPETRRLLNGFYAPFNQQLQHMQVYRRSLALLEQL